MNFFKKLSLKLRLTLLFVFLFTLLLAIFNYSLYHEYSKIRSTEFDANLYNYAIDVAESLDIDSYGEVEFDPGIIKLNEKMFPFSLGKSFITVLDVNGKIVAHSQNTIGDTNNLLNESVLFRVLKKGASYSDMQGLDGTRFRVIHYLLPVLKIDSPLILQIVVPTISMDQTKSNLKQFIIMSISIIILLSIFIGYGFMGRALLPIVEITKKTNQIEVKNLKDRVPVPMSKDEIRNLAMTINHLLERLDLSFESQERFVQNASHQLKTPLAIIKGELEIFRSDKRSELELSRFLESMAQEIDSLVKLTNDLLILARVDNVENHSSLSMTAIDEVLLTQVSRLSKLASKKNVSLNINFDEFYLNDGSNPLINVDSELIGVLFFNYIENAIKYSEAETCVDIKAKRCEQEITIEVKDQGMGIRPGQEEKIFDRFYRGDSNHRTQGSGLGLAICKAVAKLHDGEVWASRNIDGVGATFYFKLKNKGG